MNDQIVNLLEKRCNRSIAIIMSVKDRTCGSLSNEDSDALRKVILDQLNDFCDLAINMLKTTSDDSIILNEEYLNKIDAIYEAING